ncbi:MAG: sulfotransferase domain-containing protein [Pseudomonadota bacterium]
MTQRIFHITLPKCGSQWVRDVLSEEGIWSEKALRKSTGNLDFHANRKLFDREGNFFSPVFTLSLYDWTTLRRPGDKAFVVLRDPRDRLVSLLFSLLYSHEADTRINCWREIFSSQKSISTNLKLLMMTEARIPFYLSWCEDIPAECMIVHYENLVTDQIATFIKVASWTDIEFSKTALINAVEQFSFERQSGRLKGVEDKFSHFRTANPGDWRNYFNRSLGKLLEDLYPGCMRRLGYEKEDTWWELLPHNHEPKESDDNESNLNLISAHITTNKALAAKVSNLELENQAQRNEIQLLSHACKERLDLINQINRIADERLVLIDKLNVIAEERLKLNSAL